MTATTKAQRAAMHKLYMRASHPSNDYPFAGSYLTFRREFMQGFDCMTIHLWGMWIGIERDGYTHS